MARKETVEAEVVNENFQEYWITRRKRSGIFWGLMLIAFGGVLVAQDYLGINLLQYFWPGVLVVFGLWLIIRTL